MRPIISLTCAVGPAFLTMTAALGVKVVSDGSDGPFKPTGSQTIQLNNVAPDGVLNYTTIHIPANVTIRFARNSRNTPVFLAATGDVLIEGTIDISGGDFSVTGGPGGWNGGAGGGYSTEPCPRDPFLYSSGAHGGQGYLFICGGLTLDPAATITATMEQPGFARTDFNQDGHVDQGDFEIFQPCVSGPAVRLEGNCGIADFDADADVDGDDFGVFQKCYTGPADPADPCCGH